MKTKIFILLLIILSFAITACEFRIDEQDAQETSLSSQEFNLKDYELSKEQEDEHDHDHEHEHSVEIEGKEMRMLTVQEIANLWEINSEDLLLSIISEFKLEKEYTVNTLLDVMRQEYKFSPGLVKDLAEDLKAQI